MRPMQRAVYQVSDFVRHRLPDEMLRVLRKQHGIEANPVFTDLGESGADAAQIPFNGRQFESSPIQGLDLQERFNYFVFHSANDLAIEVHGSNAATSGGWQKRNFKQS